MANEQTQSSTEEQHIIINHEHDIVVARQAGRDLAARIGFSNIDRSLIATAISELARNIISYAQKGEVIISVIHEADRQGIEIVAVDQGPGIEDISKAMEDGFSTGKSLGLGLPGAKRIMGELVVTSEFGKGTMVKARKWTR